MDVVHRISRLDLSRRDGVDSRVPRARNDPQYRSMHLSGLARLFDYVPLSLDHLQNQNRKSPTRFARDCPGRIGWQAAQLGEHSPGRRRLRTPRSDHSWLKTILSTSCQTPWIPLENL